MFTRSQKQDQQSFRKMILPYLELAIFSKQQLSVIRCYHFFSVIKTFCMCNADIESLLLLCEYKTSYIANMLKWAYCKKEHQDEERDLKRKTRRRLTNGEVVHISVTSETGLSEMNPVHCPATRAPLCNFCGQPLVNQYITVGYFPSPIPMSKS